MTQAWVKVAGRNGLGGEQKALILRSKNWRERYCMISPTMTGRTVHLNVFPNRTIGSSRAIFLRWCDNRRPLRFRAQLMESQLRTSTVPPFQDRSGDYPPRKVGRMGQRRRLTTRPG